MRFLALLACTTLVACGSVPLDTRLHAGAGGIAYTAQAIALPNTWRSTPFERCALATAAGVAKEIHDSTGRGDVEARDVIGTVVGCLVVDAVVQAVQGNDLWTGQPR